MEAKVQRLAKDNNSDVLTQLKQDMNTGYHMFNQKLGRYYSRKQQFTNLVASQQLYQQPVDSIRIMGITTLVSATYEPPLKQIRSEEEWRRINAVKGYTTNWPVYYYVIGKDLFGIWPIPSANVTNGIRYWYQPQDSDLSVEDATSTSLSATVTVTNASTTVTASSGVFTAAMVGLKFQVTGVDDLTWYDIVANPSTSTLTLKSPYVATTGSGLSFRIGQVSIIPQEYQEAPIHWALWNYFESNANEKRAQFHKDAYDSLVENCQEDYSSSNVSGVITQDEQQFNPWYLPPVPG